MSKLAKVYHSRHSNEKNEKSWKTHGGRSLSTAGAHVPYKIVGWCFGCNEFEKPIWICWPAGWILLSLLQKQICHLFCFCNTYLYYLTLSERLLCQCFFRLFCLLTREPRSMIDEIVRLEGMEELRFICVWKKNLDFIFTRLQKGIT